MCTYTVRPPTTFEIQPGGRTDEAHAAEEDCESQELIPPETTPIEAALEGRPDDGKDVDEEEGATPGSCHTASLVSVLV